MSPGERGTSDTRDLNSRPFGAFWETYLQQVDEPTRQLLMYSLPAPLSRREMRAWLEVMSQGLDAYLRSPPFLAAMREQIQAVIRFQEASPTGSQGLPYSWDRADHRLFGGEQLSEWLARMPRADTNLPERFEAIDQPIETRSIWDRFLSAWQRADQHRADQHRADQQRADQQRADQQRADQQRADQRAGGGESQTPHDCVHSWESCRLLRYRRDQPSRLAEPVLVCFSLINRPYILDLQPDRSVIRRLMEGGLDVYLLDWGVPTESHRSRRLSDYIAGDLREAVAQVAHHASASRVHLLGYCMGGTMAAAYAAWHPDRVASLGLMAAPIDFGEDGGLLRLWTQESHFDVDGLIDAFGNCPGWLLQHCFRLTKPVQNYLEKYLTLYEKSHDDAFLENFFAMERWVNDSIPVAGETFREFVKLFYRSNQLVRGEYLVDGNAVRLERITCPLLLLMAKTDHLVSPAATRALTRYARSTDVQELAIDAGHIGLAVSSKAHRQLWPAAAHWFAEHSTAR